MAHRFSHNWFYFLALRNFHYSMYLRLIIILNLILGFGVAKAQTMAFPQEGNADCVGALEIKDSLYGPTVPPEGFGKSLDIETNTIKDPYLFEKEHNTLWYRFEALYTAELSFDVLAVDSMDDFDFVLFKENGVKNLCDKIKKNEAKPIRTNMARSEEGNKGKTGLSTAGEAEFVSSGPGNSYSKPIEAIQGDVYYLVVDNFSKEGKGHSIHMHYKGYPKKRGSLSVAVQDFRVRKKIKADVEILELPVDVDERENKLDYYLTGELSYTVELEPNRTYEVSCSAIGYFFYSEIITTTEVPKDQRIRVKLARVNLGEKLTLENIEFFGDAAKLMPKSYITLDHLVNFMKRNVNVSVEIQGHVNAPDMGNSKEIKNLSESRAESVYNYLVSHNVDRERLKYKGYGNKQMIFENPANEMQEAANRRVDVLVTRIKSD